MNEKEKKNQNQENFGALVSFRRSCALGHFRRPERTQREGLSRFSLFFVLSPRGARSFFFFPFRVAEMDESLDAEPRLFVGQVR